MITFLFDNILKNKFVSVTDALSISPERLMWDPLNQNLLQLYNSHDLFNMIPIDDYDNHPNSYYVISMRSWCDFTDTYLWSSISENHIDILVTHNIPILLWYPLEAPDNSHASDWKKIIDIKNSSRLRNNKLLMLSASQVVQCNAAGDFIKTSNELDKIGVIPSINYNIQYGAYIIPNMESGRSFYYKHKQLVCNAVDHDLSEKKYDFVCLNNIIETRLNRLLLLQALYVNKNLYEKNIISARFGLDNGMLSRSAYNRLEFFLTRLQSIIKYHDTELISTDESLSKLINMFCKSVNIYDHGPPLYQQFNALKKELGLIDKSELSDTANFLRQLLFQTIDVSGGVFPKQVPDQEHPRVEQEDKDILKTYEQSVTKNKIVGDLCGVNTGPTGVIYNQNNGMLNTYWNPRWYKDTWFSIITESWDFHDEDVSNGVYTYFPIMSEKTVKSILNHHPFITFGSPGQSRLLQKCGFKTFDQSLLGLPNDFTIGNLSLIERLYHLVASLENFSKKSHQEKSAIWDSVKSDTIHNFNVLLESDWIAVQHDLILNCDTHLTVPIE